MNKWVIALLLIFPVYVYAVVLPSSLPKSLSDVKTVVDGESPLIAYLQDNGKYYCIRQNSTVFVMPAKLANETDLGVLLRALQSVITHDLNPEDQALCNRFSIENRTVWLTHQVGETLYRPLYRLEGFSPASKEQIGTIPTLTPCGAHIAPVSARIKALEWHEVGGGVSVCKRQLLFLPANR